jgi:hypothetical protein
MSDEGDDDKSGFSDAFKRAGVKFGIGRYLYRDGVPGWVEGGAKAKPKTAQPSTKTDPPGQRLAQWAARNPDAQEFLTRLGDDLGLPRNMNDWNQDQCEKASTEWHKLKQAQRAQAVSAN